MSCAIEAYKEGKKVGLLAKKYGSLPGLKLAVKNSMCVPYNECEYEVEACKMKNPLRCLLRY
jgi:hypothetical protein